MMKKKILTLVAVCAAMTANATVLRVSNVNGSTAPYSTIQAAHDAASAGDTIMVDGSETRYGLTEISKQLVLIGPGFWINDNGLVQEAVPSATAEFLIHADAAGTVIEGFTFKYVNTQLLTINADNCIVRRCYFYNHTGYTGIRFSRDKVDDVYSGPDPSGAIIQQNFFADCGITTQFLESLMTNVQITNNIFMNNEGEADIRNINSSYIAYNTMVGGTNWQGFNTVYSSTIKHNIIRTVEVNEILETHPNWKLWLENIHYVDTNEWSDNYEMQSAAVEYSTDKDILNLETIKDKSKDYGAFAGDSPYVISGIPAAPVIEDLIVPTTVEAGSKMKVTLKVGVQK